METVKLINLGVAFLLELCMLAALGYWGFQTGSSGLVKVVLGIGGPVIAAVIWGFFLAPRSTRRVHDPWHLLLQLIIFGVAAVALAAAGQPTLSVVFAILCLVNVILLRVWKQNA
jgi:hypothetical protein